ncbi:MAG: formyltransferase family protein, partial [Nitrospinales bacterium]
LAKQEMLDILNEKFENKIINFHPSLLPSFKGLNAIDQALEQNAFLLGNTAHFINEKPDSGLVIMQSIIHSSRYKTYDNVLDLQIPMLIQIMRWIKMDRLSITDEKVTVQNADYSVGPFMPKLEIEP